MSNVPEQQWSAKSSWHEASESTNVHVSLSCLGRRVQSGIKVRLAMNSDVSYSPMNKILYLVLLIEEFILGKK